MISKTKKLGTFGLCLLGAISLTAAQKAPSTPPKAPSEIVAEAPKSAWLDINADDLVVFTLKDGTSFTIELASQYTPVHAANIKKLVRAGWFDSAAIVRVQDNYVVQWGRPEGTQLPNDVIAKPPAEYDWRFRQSHFTPLGFRDAYSARAGYLGTWPAATDLNKAWLTHCYGMVGVGRDMAPDTGTGGELYTVMGHAPRHLDRNIALVGRVISGMENLTARPRGTEALGFYKEPSQQIGFNSAKMASDLPIDARPIYQALNPKSASFRAWVNARANRGAPFFIRPAGAVDICNAQVPIRQVPN